MEDFKTPEFTGKNEYLYYVKAQDGIKNEIQWQLGLQCTQETMAKINENPKKRNKNKDKQTAKKSKSG